ncbi:hypothetical protein [Rhodopirellula bahusiensis]|uniref:hypothetical protein n=1 Tax=Rhodopirellula bahusiensis TaxID=2014065 RepID=UPI0032654780
MTDDSRDVRDDLPAVAPDELRIEVKSNARGAAATVVCKLGATTIHVDKIDPAKAADRKRYAAAVITAMGDGCPIAAADIDAELIVAADKLDADKMKVTDADDQPLPVYYGEELDASQVIRPELIVRRDLSAIAVPRLLDADGKVIGDWLLFQRCGDVRRVQRLGDRLDPGDGPSLWLSPVPSEPTAEDVKRFNRWTPQSREAWTNGEPSPTTAETLVMVAERINRYVVLPPGDAMEHALTLAAWVMMTYAYPTLPAVPYLYLAGPPGSGKTRTMDVLSRMVFRPFMTGNASAPVIFRTRHAFGGVLLLDEAERMRDTRSPDVQEILSILLSGYRRGGSASRMEPKGDGYQNRSFDCYGPVVLGCIKGLPPALSSRCITVRMMRATKDDPQIERSLDDTPEQAATVLDGLHRWTLDHAAAAMASPVPSSLLACRDAELWGPLLRIVARTGNVETVALLVDHAEQMTQAAADDATPEFDEMIVTAFYRLRCEGQTPRACDVLERARLLDGETFDQAWKPRMVGGILKRYFTERRTNGRKVYRDSVPEILAVANRYGFDVEGSRDE